VTQCPLGGVGLGFLESALVDFAEGSAGTVTEHCAVPGNDCLAGRDFDADPHGIVAGLGADPGILPDTLGRDGLPIPPVEPEDPVCLVVAEGIALSAWRLRRSCRIEAALFGNVQRTWATMRRT